MVDQKLIDEKPSKEKKDRKTYRKEYYQNNREKCDEYARKYRENHIENIRDYARKYYQERINKIPMVLCECGQYVRKPTLRTHQQTQRHFKHMALIPKNM